MHISAKKILLTTVLLIVMFTLFLIPHNVSAAGKEIIVDATNPDLITAVQLANDGDTITVLPGNYVLPYTLNIDKQILIIGAGDELTNIDYTAPTGYGINVTSSNVSLKGFTFNALFTDSYPIKVAPNLNPGDPITNITIEDITVLNNPIGRTGIDINGVDGGIINDISVIGSGSGNGIGLTDSRNITISNVNTSGNTWGGIAVYAAGNYFDNNVDNITITGTNNIAEPNKIYTGESNGKIITNLTLPSEYQYYLDDNSQKYYQTSLEEAKSLHSLFESLGYSAVIRSLDGKTIHVLDGMSLLEAIDAAEENTTIFVYPGTYHVSDTYNTTPIGLNIDISGLSIIGVDENGIPIDDPNNIQASIISDIQSNWGTNFFVTADNVTISGVGLYAVGSPAQPYINKALEIISDNFTLTNSVIDSHGNFDIYGAIYINDYGVSPGTDSNTFISAIEKCYIDNNIIFGNVTITNGAGLNRDNPEIIISNNQFLTSSNGNTLLTGIFHTGNEEGINWRNASAILPIVYGNIFDATTDDYPYYFRSRDDDPTKIADLAYIQELLANNTFSSFAYLTFEDQIKQIISGENNIVYLWSSIDEALANAYFDDTLHFGYQQDEYLSTLVPDTEYLYIVNNGGRDLYFKTLDDVKVNIDSNSIVYTRDKNSLLVLDGMSISKTINAAQENNTIYIYPGNYIATDDYYTTGDIGLHIDVNGLSIIGVDENGTPIDDPNNVQATITSSMQSDWGTNFFITADDVRISGVKLVGNVSAHQDYVNKVIEVTGDKFTLTSSVIDGIAGKDIYGAVYINDFDVPIGTDSSTFVSNIETSYIINNIIYGNVSISNGVGLNRDMPEILIANNTFADSENANTVITGVYHSGNQESVAWRNASAVLPIIIDNIFLATPTEYPYYFRSLDDDSSLMADDEYIFNIIQNNSFNSYAYVFDNYNIVPMVNDNGTSIIYLFINLDGAKTQERTDEIIIYYNGIEELIYDDTNPTLTVTEPIDIEVFDNTHDFAQYATFSDNYDNSPILDIDTSQIDFNVLGSYPITYTVTDSSGNFTIVTATVNIIDTTNPTLTVTEPIDVEVFDIAHDFTQYASFSDLYDIEPILDIKTSQIDFTVLGSYDITFIVTDSSGNFTTVTTTVNIVDTTNPDLIVNEPILVEVFDVDHDFTQYASFSDIYDIEPILDIDTSQIDFTVLGSYDITFIVTDSSGNFTTVTATVNIVDTTDPTLTVTDPITVEVFDVNHDFAQYATFSDLYDIEPILDINTSQIDFTVLGSYPITYTVTDSSGNFTIVTATVNIVDTTDPTLTVTEPIDVEVFDIAHDFTQYASFSDLYDIEPILDIDTSQIDFNVLGSYDITFIVTDSSGNFTTVTTTVNIVDTTNPDLIVIEPILVEVFDVDHDFTQYATFSDNYDNSPILNIDTSQIDFNVLGSYPITYTVTDSSGNFTTVTATVNIIDTTNPTLTVTEPIDVEVFDITHDFTQYATFSDNYDNSPILNIDTSQIDFNVLGSYDITYTVTDSSGNFITVIATANIVDTTDPTLTVTEPIDVEVFDIAHDFTQYASFSDLYDIEPILDINTSQIDFTVLGSYPITYTVTDSSGNFTTITATVNIIDTTNPTLTVTDPIDVEVFDVNHDFTQYATFSDLYDIEPILDINTSQIDFTVLGSYDITFTVTDSSDNFITVITTVNIIDTTAPTITISEEPKIPLNSPEYSISTLIKEIIDNYYDNLIVLIDDTAIDYQNIGLYEVKVSAYDGSGNFSTTTFNVEIIDNIAPTFDLSTSSVTLDYGFTVHDFEQYVLNMLDNYDELSNLTLIIDDSEINHTSIGSYKVTITLQDSNGNETIKTITVNIEDNIAPIISGYTNKSTKDISSFDFLENVTAFDNVEGNISENIKVYTEIIDDNLWKITLTSTDSSGNEASATYELTISNSVNWGDVLVTAVITTIILASGTIIIRKGFRF